MPSKSLWRIAIWGSGLVLLGLSISSIVLSRIANTEWTAEDHLDSGGGEIGYYGTENMCDLGLNHDSTVRCRVKLRPDHLEEVTLDFITAVGSVSIAAMVLALCFVLGSVPYQKSIISMLLIAAIEIALVLSVFVYSMVEFYKSDRSWRYQASPGSIYSDSSNRAYTIESWACAIKNSVLVTDGTSVEHDFSRVCNPAKAARWITLPLLIFAVLFFALAIISLMRKRDFQNSEEYMMQKQAAKDARQPNLVVLEPKKQKKSTQKNLVILDKAEKQKKNTKQNVVITKQAGRGHGD